MKPIILSLVGLCLLGKCDGSEATSPHPLPTPTIPSPNSVGPETIKLPDFTFFTISCWSGGRDCQQNPCEGTPSTLVPKGYTLIAEDNQVNNRKTCKIPADHCDSTGESCRDIVASDVCFVRNDVLESYKKFYPKLANELDTPDTKRLISQKSWNGRLAKIICH